MSMSSTFLYTDSVGWEFSVTSMWRVVTTLKLLGRQWQKFYLDFSCHCVERHKSCNQITAPNLHVLVSGKRCQQELMFNCIDFKTEETAWVWLSSIAIWSSTDTINNNSNMSATLLRQQTETKKFGHFFSHKNSKYLRTCSFCVIYINKKLTCSSLQWFWIWSKFTCPSDQQLTCLKTLGGRNLNVPKSTLFCSQMNNCCLFRSVKLTTTV